MDVLVDTSVWSLALRRGATQLNQQQSSMVTKLAQLAHEGRALLIGPIRQELLTGIRHPVQFETLRKRLCDFPDVPLASGDYERAAEAANRCIAAGVAVTDVDLLICAVAMDRGWQVYTADQDFFRYAKVLGVALYGSPRTAQ